MYEPMETDISFRYLKDIASSCKNLKFGIIGGWGVFFHVNAGYRRAFGIDYLKSRDIDVFISSKDELKFKKIIKKFNFIKAEYFFRYKLIFDRERKMIVDEKTAKKIPVYNLIEIFLDIFSDKKTRIGSWVIKELKEAKIELFVDIPVVDINSLIQLKCISFFEREKLDKELKDACDIYALLLYSNKRIKKNNLLKKAIEKIISRDDLCDFIAENVLNDQLKSSLVKITMQNYRR